MQVSAAAPPPTKLPRAGSAAWAQVAGREREGRGESPGPASEQSWGRRAVAAPCRGGRAPGAGR
jgi:hypothetical protein